MVSAGIGIGIGLIALAIILSAPGETDLAGGESTMGVELSDEVKVVSEESKSYDVNISEGVEIEDGQP